MTRQTDEKSLYEQQEDRILAQSDAFISLLTKRGILGDHEIDNEKIRTAQQKRTQTSYHNTKMLLQHYRTIAWVLECFPTDVAAELDTPFEHIDQLEISKRTYYRLRQQAITILSIRLWATPAIGIDFWFDMLTLLENLE